MTFAAPLLWLFSLPILSLFAVFLIENTLGQFSRKKIPTLPRALGRVAILMPAHNEAGGIAQTLHATQPHVPKDAHIIVIADNCTDATADLARAAGAFVIERSDPEKRGKGYALAFGRDYLCNTPPDYVIILDADCTPEAGALNMLLEAAISSGQPVQARYLMAEAPQAKPKVQISNFAFLIKNFIRQRGVANLGGAAVLTGTGMVFPWEIFKDAPLASSNIVEDLALGIHLARGGHPPLFVENAIILSAAATEEATLTQRRRWEHGFLDTARSQGLPLLADGLTRGKPALFWLGLHLLVPPLSLLFLTGLLVLTLLYSAGFLGLGYSQAFALTAAMLASIMIVLLSWLRYGRATLTPSTLVKIPLYILWKLPIYLGLFKGVEKSWVRTERPEK